MKKSRVIFYKARFGDGHWIDNAISSWTWLISSKNKKVGPYSHVEIWTPDEEGRFIKPMGEMISTSTSECGSTCTLYTPKDVAIGTCWTSTMRGESNGTVKRPANTIINNPARWDYCEIGMDDTDYMRMHIWMNLEVMKNKGYSKRDLLKFFGLGFMADKTKNICSEFCNNAIQQAWGLDDDMVVSPRRLAWKLRKAGYQIKPLK